MNARSKIQFALNNFFLAPQLSSLAITLDMERLRKQGRNTAAVDYQLCSLFGVEIETKFSKPQGFLRRDLEALATVYQHVSAQHHPLYNRSEDPIEGYRMLGVDLQTLGDRNGGLCSERIVCMRDHANALSNLVASHQQTLYR